jgi:hypothetical protein
MKRVVHLGLALGSTALLAAGVVASCYRVPTPTCGFRCGPNGECPADYTCSMFEDRCHLNGTDPAIRCDTIDDEPTDAPADVPIDLPIADAAQDAPQDAGADAPSDAPVD